MKLSSLRVALLTVLWGTRSTSGQDIISSDVADPLDPVVTDPVQDITTTSSDESSNTDIVEPPDGSDGTDPGPIDEVSTTTVLIETSTEVDTSETVVTETAGTKVSTTATEDTTSGTPTPTSDLGDAREIVLVTDPSLLTNSTDPFEPAELTPDVWAEEEAVNKPITELSEEDAEQIAIHEGYFFNDFVVNAPATGDREPIEIPANTTDCDPGFDKRSSRLRKRIWPFGNRKPPCINVYAMKFIIHFNYILPTTFGDVPKDLWLRVNSNFILMNEAFGALGITFDFGSGRHWYPPREGFNRDWSSITKNEDRLLSWQRQSYQGDKMHLNVWILNDLQGLPRPDGLSFNLLGYATFPQDIAAKGKLDGVVVPHSVLGELLHDGSGQGSTLVHEIGHWLGIYHTFGQTVTSEADDCQFGDGLLQTTLTRGHVNTVFNCRQIPCGRTSGEIEVDNWMSYSDCPGGPAGDRGFSTDQKAAMYARAVYWRRGLRRAECNPSDPGTGSSKMKRSTMQDLVDGKCPDVEAAAEEMLEYDEQVVDPEAGDGGDGGSGNDEDDEDMAAGLRIMSFLLWSLAAVASFALLV